MRVRFWSLNQSEIIEFRAGEEEEEEEEER